MSVQQQAGDSVVTRRDQLAAYLEQGAKSASACRIGVEHEKFVFDTATLKPVPFDGPRGIEALLKGLCRFGWRETLEQGRVIGLAREGANISLEPGGQLELSGAAFDTLHPVALELSNHIEEANAVAGQMGIGFLAAGYHPTADRDQFDFMPKGRYRIMRGYMPKVGGRGIDMMLRTCTAQVNLDFTGEADMVGKLRMALKLQPVATALFANSPFAEGQAGSNLSERAAVWLDVDRARTGSLDLAFEPGFGFERYVDYALDVPMYFVYRDGRYIDASGLSFRDFMAGRLAVLPGEAPTFSDWADHLTTIFTDARLKQYIEMRGADVGLPPQIMAVAALWTGLFYDAQALQAASDLAATIDLTQLPELRVSAARDALANPVLRTLASEMVEIAAGGLSRRARLDDAGQDETKFLEPVREAVAEGRSPAHFLLAAYNGDWHRDLSPMFKANRY